MSNSSRVSTIDEDLFQFRSDNFWESCATRFGSGRDGEDGPGIAPFKRGGDADDEGKGGIGFRDEEATDDAADVGRESLSNELLRLPFSA